jgi:hypothetical protein
LCAHFAAETLAGGLAEDAQGDGYPVPAWPVRPGERDAFGKQCLVSPRTLVVEPEHSDF